MLCQPLAPTRLEGPLVTEADRNRLHRLLKRLRAGGQARLDHLAALEQHVETATRVSPRRIPRNVVTLNSRVQLRDIESGKRSHLTLASPFDTTLFGDRLSVAGPAGIALLGKRVGQTVAWVLGPKVRRYRIEKVIYQPEAAGDFHL